MVGSVFEFKNKKSKEFDIYNPYMKMTDDSLLTIAVAKTLLANYPVIYDEVHLNKIKEELAKEFARTLKLNKFAGFGGMFIDWCIKYENNDGKAEPYNSFGNGSAMRISPVGWIASSEEEVKILSKAVTEITHNHPEGLKGAEAVAMAIYLALHGSSKEEIKQRMVKDYYPEIETLDFDDLVENYDFYPICQKSVPQAIYCFLLGDSVEDTIRNCIAIGGDCDTTAAMAGSIAEAYYSKDKLSAFEEKYLYLMIDPEVEKQIRKFHKTIGSNKFGGK
ncbi:MAG: ADP-ribosylglycohydrolase family protein [Bacilli bacterium]|nr:ADP-ribosylglycohydrolase family protein [Bacilli bacterium]